MDDIAQLSWPPANETESECTRCSALEMDLAESQRTIAALREELARTAEEKRALEGRLPPVRLTRSQAPPTSPSQRRLVITNPDAREDLFSAGPAEPLECECSSLRQQLAARDNQLQGVRTDLYRRTRLSISQQARVDELEDMLQNTIDQHQEELEEARTQAQGATDRLYIANYQGGDARERLTMAEQALAMYEADITELTTRNISLEDTIKTRGQALDARDAQIRILQFSLDQRVRSALLDSGDVPSFEISGPATVEAWSGFGQVVSSSAAPTIFDSGSEHGTLSSSGADTDASMEDDARTTSGSDFGSFSDVSGPPSSFAGTPRSTSPSPFAEGAGSLRGASPVPASSDEDWSDLEGGVSTDDDGIFSGTSTPARAPSPPASVSPEPDMRMLADEREPFESVDGAVGAPGRISPLRTLDPTVKEEHASVGM